MLEYEVTIGDAGVVPPVDPTQATPEVRIVVWRGVASSDDDAQTRAWQQWDRTYGEGSQPVSALVRVAKVEHG